MQVYVGTRLSTVIGSSYTYLLPTISMILSKHYAYFIDPYEVSNCIEIGLPTIILLVIFVLYLPNAMS
ncbi:hypothetical protein ZIOFF_021287 [Zingiber officinale]|uniref:Uncharacterized protein n=1 Tax=Zingiber officinale TaxID=94328 RepID=A0A8J5H190_ZINOF|nr:hypothetical protein ZIOFF_021287 [Zingiber officinale]